jgi:hypothetical protein
MAVTHVQSVKGTTSCTFASTTAGNCLVLLVLSSSSTVTVASWTQISTAKQVGGSGSFFVSTWFRPNNPGGITTVTPGGTGSRYQVIGMEFSGCTTSTAAYGYENTNGTTSVTTSNTTSTIALTSALTNVGSYSVAAGDLLVSVWGAGAATTVVTYVSESSSASGWSPSGGTADQVGSTTGSSPTTFLGNYYGTYSSSVNMTMSPVNKSSSGTVTLDWAGWTIAIPAFTGIPELALMGCGAQ